MITKFVALLGIVLLLFYGVVTHLKKGMIRRGKLGLLKDLDSVAVLSTTYIGPKKTLMVVKAHQQVFLLASSEQGVHFLSEIRDVPGVFKESEKVMAGNNFDTTLVEAKVQDKPMTLKEENENQKNDKEGKSLAEFLASDALDKVKISQQIKNKVKSLKPLQ